MDKELTFYKGKRVLITGQTGFKGTWMSVMLANAGASVIGYALEPEDNPNLYDLSGVNNDIVSIIGDVRDRDRLKKVFDEFKPEIVFHLAAQPLVRLSYEHPADTYGINVMGTVNVLECIRLSGCVKSFLNVTTDKVYDNKEFERGYVEDDPLDGYDPYSNSKSCSELVTHSYKKSFFSDGQTAISTARAGNVIGGGDFSKDRIIPDCVRAAISSCDIVVRNPYSIRPYQHVLDPLYVYLMIAQAQYENVSLSGFYNVGPEISDCYRTGDLVDLFVSKWDGGLKRVDRSDDGPHEANFLKLDCSKLKNTFGWKPVWNLEKAVSKTVEWTKCWNSGADVRCCMNDQIEEFLRDRYA